MSMRKNPFAALVLSAIVPGLGQIYSRKTRKGLVIFASCLGLGLFTYWLSGFDKIGPALALVLLWLSAAADAYIVAKTSGQAREFYYRRTYVVAMLLFVGPLALPLLWQSPNFSAAARWIWAVIVVGVVLLFIGTPYLVKRLVG